MLNILRETVHKDAQPLKTSWMSDCVVFSDIYLSPFMVPKGSEVTIQYRALWNSLDDIKTQVNQYKKNLIIATTRIKELQETLKNLNQVKQAISLDEYDRAVHAILNEIKVLENQCLAETAIVSIVGIDPSWLVERESSAVYGK